MSEVVVGIVQHEDEYLHLQRLNGLWTFPSGKVELGETFREAVLREIKEETNVEAEIVQELGTRELENLNLHYFLCSYKSGEFKLTEPDKFRSVVLLSPDGVMQLAGDKIFKTAKDLLSEHWERIPQQEQDIAQTLDWILSSDDAFKLVPTFS